MSLNDIRISLHNAIHCVRKSNEKHLTLTELFTATYRADYVFGSWTSLDRVKRDDGVEMRLVAMDSDGNENSLTTYQRNVIICGIDEPDFKIIRVIRS